jgi:hypothetical protein
MLRSFAALSAAAPAAGRPAAAPHYLQWGVIQISLTNFLIIVAMVVVFVLALVLPFPAGQDEEQRPGEGRDDRR